MNPNLSVWAVRTNVMSFLIDHRGCSVPLRDAAPQPANSENPIVPMFLLQSTALGIQTLSRQLPPTFNEPPSLKKVFLPKLR